MPRSLDQSKRKREVKGEKKRIGMELEVLGVARVHLLDHECRGLDLVDPNRGMGS